MRAVLRLNSAVTGMQTNDFSKNRKACKKQFGKTEEVCPYYETELCVGD
jgi:hypothetical protein